LKWDYVAEKLLIKARIRVLLSLFADEGTDTSYAASRDIKVKNISKKISHSLE